MSQINYALYYPTIEFQNYAWLWSAALLWDKIYKIVPETYIPNEPDNIKVLQENGEIGISFNPSQYAKAIAEEFIEKLTSGIWNAAALEVDAPHKIKEYSRIHKEKVDVKLREIIVATGKGSLHKEWLYVPTSFEALYMTYLANSIAEKNNFQLVSDSTAAWTGSTYFKYDGLVEDYPSEYFEAQLATLVIRDFIPENIATIHPKEILEFRRLYRDERKRFVNAIKNAASTISNCNDPKIICDLIEDLKIDVKNSVKDYRKSLRFLKITGWMGIESITFPVATPVIGNLIHLDPGILKILSTVGIGLGLVSGLAKMDQEVRKLSKESDYSYLLHLERKWKKCYRGYDYNYFLCRQMEEFIND